MHPEAFKEEVAEVTKSTAASAGNDSDPLMQTMLAQCAAQAFIESASTSLGQSFQDIFDNHRLANFSFIDGAADLIRRLQRQGLGVVIITSGHEEIQRPKLRACCAADVFGDTNIIVGGEELRAGREDKPNASIFMKACAIAGCEPSEACMVGDSLQSDIQGAINSKLAASVW